MTLNIFVLFAVLVLWPVALYAACDLYWWIICKLYLRGRE